MDGMMIADALGWITGLVIVLLPLVIAYLRADTGEEGYTGNDGWEPPAKPGPWRPPRGMEHLQPRTDVRTYQARHQRQEKPVPGTGHSKVTMYRHIQSKPRD